MQPLLLDDDSSQQESKACGTAVQRLMGIITSGGTGIGLIMLLIVSLAGLYYGLPQVEEDVLQVQFSVSSC